MYERSTHAHDAYSCEDCLAMQEKVREVLSDGLNHALDVLHMNPTGENGNLSESDRGLVRGLELAIRLIKDAPTV